MTAPNPVWRSTAKPPSARRRWRVTEAASGSTKSRQHLERGEPQIGVALFAEVGAAGRLAQDLDHHHRLVLEMFSRRVRLADDHRVGVIKAGVVREFDADLGVAVEGLAGLAAELIVQDSKGIPCDEIVEVGMAGYCENHSAQKLPLHGAALFGSEVVDARNERGCGVPDHPGKLENSRQVGKPGIPTLTRTPDTR